MRILNLINQHNPHLLLVIFKELKVMITLHVNTNPKCVEVKHSLAPPLTGRHTARRHSLLKPFELHPKCTQTHARTQTRQPDTDRLSVIYSQTDTKAQNHLFRKPHPLCLTSVFLL